MREVYEYKYKYKYKYGYGDQADQWQGREPYDDGCVEEPMERQQNRYIRVRNLINPYSHENLLPIVRVKIGYELGGKRRPHPETDKKIPELERNQERSFVIPPNASHVDVEIERLLIIIFYPTWPRLCFYENLSLPFCIDIKSIQGVLLPKCEIVRC
jgi:hypothetical protein